MRMVHFIDPQGVEKNHDWHSEIGENNDWCLSETSNTVWAKIKRWLLAFVRRERL